MTSWRFYDNLICATIPIGRVEHAGNRVDFQHVHFAGCVHPEIEPSIALEVHSLIESLAHFLDS